jgi:6-phosphofructokinase 1
LPHGGLVTQEERSREERQVRLGGIGNVVASEIQRRLGRETRVVVLGHLQRGGAPTTFDRVLATQFGAHAVRLIEEQRFGEMVCYHPPAMLSVPILEAITLSRVGPQCSAVQAARALGISFGDGNAALPFERCSPAEKTPADEEGWPADECYQAT